LGREPNSSAKRDFGPWPSSPEEASIEDCDFSQATLDACRFLGCDVRTLRLPSWPRFTFIDPVARWRELRAHSWPGKLAVMKGFCRLLSERHCRDAPNPSTPGDIAAFP